MILQRGGGKKYGIPYQGSKAKIMESLNRMFPNADNFYDLFGGGFSVTHYMIENRSKSYKQFHYNELRQGVPQLVQDAINGKYNFDVFTPGKKNIPVSEKLYGNKIAFDIIESFKRKKHG